MYLGVSGHLHLDFSVLYQEYQLSTDTHLHLEFEGSSLAYNANIAANGLMQIIPPTSDISISALDALF